MAELVISFGGKKWQSFKIKRWTKELKQNLRIAMFDIGIELERAFKLKLNKPQKSGKQTARKGGGIVGGKRTRKRAAKKTWASPSPFKDLRARSGRLRSSFIRDDKDAINDIKNERGLPALHFGTKVVYAAVHEFGYKKIPKRAYFGPTIKKKKKFIVKTLVRALRFK